MKAYNLIPVLKKNNWIQKIGTILICIFSIVNPSDLYSQKRNTFIQDSLDNYIINSMKLWEIPGVAVSIIKNDSVIYCKGFGVNKRKKSC
jgi:CubicO group peptidase (beta-lactamase class C family)